jgi:hypothetical protein
MKFAWGKVLLAACILLPCISSAQDPTKEVTEGADRFEKAAHSIWDWVMSFDKDADKFVAKENQRQLVDRLRDLNHALFQVELAKRAFVFEIKNRDTRYPLPGGSLQAEVDGLVLRVGDLQGRIEGVDGLLREQQRIGGQKCEELLSGAIVARKEWVSELAQHPELLRNQATKDKVIKSGEAAIKSLHEAGNKLGEVIDELSKANP